MEQSTAATAIYAVQISDAEVGVMLIVVMCLMIAIVASLALLVKRNQLFASELMSFSDR